MWQIATFIIRIWAALGVRMGWIAGTAADYVHSKFSWPPPKKKLKNKTKKHNNRKISLLPLPSCLSNTSSSILAALEASGCHVVFLFVPPVYCRHSFFTQNKGNVERLISLLRTHYILCFLVFFPMSSSVTSPSLVISQEELCQLPSM